MKHRAMLVVALLAAGSGGCSAALRGFDADVDVHLHSTYHLARAAGFDPDASLKIAAADYFTDLHPDTTSVATERRILGGLANPISIPRILILGFVDWASGREGPARAFGGRTAETTAWALSPLNTRLHFPAREPSDPVKPAFRRNPRTLELCYNNRDSVEVLERAFLALETHDPDLDRALALLGIGLHVLQDSFKHAGFTGQSGHIGAQPDPDDSSLNVDLALDIAEATYHSLLHARRLLQERAPAIDESWKEAFRKVYETPAAAGESSETRWISLIRRSFGDAYGPWNATRAAWGTGGEAAFERAVSKIRRIWR